MTTDNRTLPGPFERAPSLTATPSALRQFQQYRQAGDEPRTGALFGMWSPAGHWIHITEAALWAGPAAHETAQVHPFAVNRSYQVIRPGGLNPPEQSSSSSSYRAQPEPQVTLLGHWLVMSGAPLVDGADEVDAMRQAGARELALLERALGAGWLDRAQLITAVREEWGRTRVRAYVLAPGLPVRRVPFPEEELKPIDAALLPPYTAVENTNPPRRKSN